MNIRKAVIGVTVVGILLIVNIAFAGSFSNAAEKWFVNNCVTGKQAPKGIEAAVCDLRQRVLALEAKAPVPGPQGAKGDKGDPGEAGQQGIQGIQGVAGVPGQLGDTIIVTNSASGGSWDTVTADANCPAETILRSGGAKITAGIQSRAFITASYPSSTTTWRAVATALDQGANFVTITTYAICSQ